MTVHLVDRLVTARKGVPCWKKSGPRSSQGPTSN